MSLDVNAHLTATIAANALENAGGHGAPAHATCLSCGTALHDQFCAHCGQPAGTHRITLHHLVFHDLPHSIWHVDKGVLYTLRQMLTRPGLAIREYLAGQRARHFRPISYLLLLVGLSALLMSSLHLDLYRGRPASEVPELLRVVMERYTHFNFKYPAFAHLILLPLNSLVAWLLLRRTGYNYAEVLTGGAFVAGTLALLGLAFVLPVILAGELGGPLAQIVWVPMVFYPLWVNAQWLTAAPRLSTAARYGRALAIALLQGGVFLFYVVASLVFFTKQVLREHPELKDSLQPKARPAAVAPAR